MANKYQDGKETIKIRGMMLRSMLDTEKSLKMMSNSLKLSIGVLNYHVKEMVEEKRVKQGKTLINGKEIITYICIDQDYFNQVARELAEKKAREDAKEKPHAMARPVLLADTVHWTPKAKQHMEVRRGSTLSTMTF